MTRLAMPLRLLAVLLLFAALAGCAEEPPPPLPPAEAAERDSVLALLRTAEREDLAGAFERLEGTAYRLTTRTTQLGPDGEVLARHEETVAVTPQGRRVLARDSSGAFDFGAFARLASEERGHPTANPALLLLPEEPPYLSPRGREAFHFAFGPDTSLGGQPVRTLLVEARPGEGDNQKLRRARLWLDPTTGDLVGARLQQQEESVLFGERSTLTVLLRPGSDGAWLPDRVEARTRLRAPLAKARHFHLTRTYDGLEPTP